MEKTLTVIDHFEIPEELAKELSSLLTKQVIRERTLVNLAGDPKYDEFESTLIPIIDKIESIKLKITRELVPLKYRNPKYTWNYNGYEIAENQVEILEMK